MFSINVNLENDEFIVPVYRVMHNVFNAIKSHAFNRELGNGTLSSERFSYYILQDSFFLDHFAKLLMKLSYKSSNYEYSGFFYNLSIGILQSEQNELHAYFKNSSQFTVINKLSPATVDYIDYLNEAVFLKSYEVGVSSIFPCFWIYYNLANYLASNNSDANPYNSWINFYTSEEFKKEVNTLTGIINDLTIHASLDIKKEMLNAIHTTSILELEFWNDAYFLNTIDYNDIVSNGECILP
jgi:thiaminase/transcriptional activator TenA